LNFASCTFTNNEGSIIIAAYTLFTMTNTIVSGNDATGGFEIVNNLEPSNFLDLGNNLVNTVSGANFNASLGSITGVSNPLLGPLQDNGGFTPTCLPLNQSRAFGKGNCDINPFVFDQRGSPFLFESNGMCDIGSVKLQPPVAPPVNVTLPPVAPLVNVTSPPVTPPVVNVTLPPVTPPVDITSPPVAPPVKVTSPLLQPAANVTSPVEPVNSTPPSSLAPNNSIQHILLRIAFLEVILLALSLVAL
jgi:hypothetical protein